MGANSWIFYAMKTHSFMGHKIFLAYHGQSTHDKNFIGNKSDSLPATENVVRLYNMWWAQH